MADEPKTPAANKPAESPEKCTVNRVQDGAEVRAELTVDQARSECAMLNAQARIQVGTTAPVYDERGSLERGPLPIYGSMYYGEISRYEVRSTSGLVLS